MAFRLFVDSSNGVTITPEFDFKDSASKVESRHRTRAGDEYVYRWGGFRTLKMKVKFVDSSFKAVVNSWWDSNADLLFMEEGGTDVTSVHITNKSQPIDGFVKPYNDLFQGTIDLGTY